VASVLYSGREGGLPDLLAVVGANTVLMLGAVLFHLGCQRFIGHPTRWPAWGLYLAASALGFTWFTYVEPNFPMRLVLFTTLVSAIYAANLHFLLRHGGNACPCAWCSSCWRPTWRCWPCGWPPPWPAWRARTSWSRHCCRRCTSAPTCSRC